MRENRVEIEENQCKGCLLCVEVCPESCIEQGSAINRIGYQFVRFVQNGCTACGFCYYICPEPGAITVFRRQKKVVDHG